jgi:hypothetical protein
MDTRQIEAEAYQRGMRDAASIANNHGAELMGHLTPRPDSISQVAFDIKGLINKANPGRGFGE